VDDGVEPSPRRSITSVSPTATTASSISAVVASGRRRRCCPDRPGEEERLLGDHAELAAQRVQRHLTQVEPVDEHPADVGS